MHGIELGADVLLVQPSLKKIRSYRLTLTDCVGFSGRLTAAEDMPFGTDLKEVLMNGNAIASTGEGKVGLNIGFDVFSSGSLLDTEQIEHEFGYGVGGG